MFNRLPNYHPRPAHFSLLPTISLARYRGKCLTTDHGLTTSTNSKSKGTNILQFANKYALSSAFVNGGASFLPHIDLRGTLRYTLKVSCSQAYICRDCRKATFGQKFWSLALHLLIAFA
ncbi:hypothetical protein SUGI_0598630 [Cryptomeria japonica]|nr:hypothetical protein SUGI_0598630 [Cryptomeria japonica]